MTAGLTWLRRARSSVRVRVTLLASGLFALALGVAAVLLLNTLEHRLVGDIRDAAEDALVQQASLVRQAGLPPDASFVQGSATAAGSAGVQIMQFDSEGRDYVLTVPAGVTVDRVLADTNGSVASGAASAAIGTFRQALGSTDQFSVSSLPLGAAVLSTASPLDEVRDTLHTTSRVLWVVGPILVAIVAALSWVLAGRALRPVRLLTSRVATIEATSLHERVPIPPSADEIAVLARTMNQMLARLDDANAASRRLVSDASHELRTPVAVMRAELEVARRDKRNDWDVTGDVLLGELDRLQGLVDDLLLLARGDEGTPPGQVRGRVELADLVNGAASRRRRVAVEADLDPEVADAVLPGDAPALGRALDHLVANAARSAASTVVVSLAPAAGDVGGGVAIHVDDDGPGIPAAARELVVQRFVRLDEGRGRDDGGAGLGLAVAGDVARGHGGRLVIGDSPLGGARVSMLFPVAVATAT